VEEIKPETVVAYIDHFLLAGDSKNAGDHVMLEGAAKRLVCGSRGSGMVSATQCISRTSASPARACSARISHTPAAGAIGMLAIGAGRLAISLALAGEPFRVPMPEIGAVALKGELPDWVSAKDVILEMLRRQLTIDAGILAG
jgi:aconitate hydratase